MRALLIILPILAALLLLLFAKVRISLSFNGKISLSVRYLFLRFSLYPRKKPKRQKQKRKKTKVKKATKHTNATQSPPKTSKKEKRRLSLGDIRFLLRLLRETLGKILDKASRHVRITLKELKITIGGERDAARAAIEYGLVAQAASYLLAYLDQTGFLKPPRDGSVDLQIDFTEREHTLLARTDISCSLFFLIPLLFSALTNALTAKGRWSRHRSKARKPQTTTDTPQQKENENG